MAGIDFLNQTMSVNPGVTGVPGSYGQTVVAADTSLDIIEFGLDLRTGLGSSTDFTVVVAKYSFNDAEFRLTELVWQSPLITYNDQVAGFDKIAVSTGGVPLAKGEQYVFLINYDAGPLGDGLQPVLASGPSTDPYKDGFFVALITSRVRRSRACQRSFG